MWLYLLLLYVAIFTICGYIYYMWLHLLLYMWLIIYFYYMWLYLLYVAIFTSTICGYIYYTWLHLLLYMWLIIYFYYMWLYLLYVAIFTSTICGYIYLFHLLFLLLSIICFQLLEIMTVYWFGYSGTYTCYVTERLNDIEPVSTNKQDTQVTTQAGFQTRHPSHPTGRLSNKTP